MLLYQLKVHIYVIDTLSRRRSAKVLNNTVVNAIVVMVTYLTSHWCRSMQTVLQPMLLYFLMMLQTEIFNRNLQNFSNKYNYSQVI